jgi:phage shock protein A
MRDISTIHALKNHVVPANREQLISEYARLEHEKARLKRELEIWINNKDKTEERIHNVQERLNHLQNLLNDMPEAENSPDFQQSSNEKLEKNSGYTEISFEY